MAGKSYIKVGTNDWDRIKKMYIKAAGQTWIAIRKAYIKTSSGWKKVFDTASNRPFIEDNDIPKIRLNTFRTNSTYNPPGTADDPVNPVVEAPPVQQMGPPTTTPTVGWPNGTVGNHLWGYDGSWVSGNGSSMTFQYKWFYRYSSNPNDDTEELNATSSTGRTDMLTNSSSHLGKNDGDYFDRNFLTFKVTATNSAGNSTQPSAAVYIVRQQPVLISATMLDKNEASLNTTMTCTFVYQNQWYNKPDMSKSFIEWFALENLGSALTTSNRVSGPEYLNSFSTSGTTTKTINAYHVPQLLNRYYQARITLNNSSTTPAEYAGSQIIVSGFTPKFAVTGSDWKNVVTTQILDPQPFNTLSFTKNFPFSSNQGITRSTNLSWQASTNATKYRIEYWGSNDNANWTQVQSFTTSPDQTTTTHTAYWTNPPSGGFDYYKFIKARVRAANAGSVTVISDGGAERYADGTAPGQPSFGSINAFSDGTATIPITSNSNQGSNYRYEQIEYKVRNYYTSYPSSWSTQSLSSSGSGTISLSGLSNSNNPYYIVIRQRNQDELYSIENETSFDIPAPPMYNVTFNGNGGTLSSGPGSGQTSYTYSGIAGTTFTVPSASRSGYSFSIWRNPESGGDPTFATPGNTYTISGSITFWAKWTFIPPNLTAPTITLVSPPSTPQGPLSVYFSGGSGPYYQFWWQSGSDYSGTTSFDANGSSSPLTDTSGPDVGTYYVAVRSVSALNNTGSGPSTSISSWSSPVQFTVNAPPPTQYTISWNANGGSVSPSSNTVNSGTLVSAPTPTRSGYTFLYWRDSPNVFSYIYQINPGGSWTVNSNITFYAYWQQSIVAPSTPTGVTVSGSGLVSWGAVNGATTYEVQNYTDRQSNPPNNNNRLGPYTTTDIEGTSFQLGSGQGYSGSNNYARAQVRARNAAGVSLYSAWFPSSTSYV